MSAQHAPHTTPLWRQVISLPHTRLGKWAIGLAAGSVSLFLWAFLFFGEEIGPVPLNVILAIMLPVVSLASGVVGSLALGAGERSLLVWLAQVPTALIFFILPNAFQEGSPWGRGSVGVLIWAVIATSIIFQRSRERSSPMETTRTSMSMTMFVLLGAVGFGTGGAIASYLLSLGNYWIVLGFLLGGALGGASLGLAFRDLRRVLSLALMGGVGLFLGSIAGSVIGGILGGLFPVLAGTPSEVITIAIVGAVLGALLGLAFVDLRGIVTLSVAGAVGFGIGYLPIRLISGVAPALDDPRVVIWITVITTVGGAFLGAALGYIEQRKTAQEQRPRVR